jgi:hypothetical protein
VLKCHKFVEVQRGKRKEAHKYCNEFEKTFTLGRSPVKELNDKSRIPRGDVELKIESIDTIPLKLLKLKFLNNFLAHYKFDNLSILPFNWLQTSYFGMLMFSMFTIVNVKSSVI